MALTLARSLAKYRKHSGTWNRADWGTFRPKKKTQNVFSLHAIIQPNPIMLKRVLGSVSHIQNGQKKIHKSIGIPFI